MKEEYKAGLEGIIASVTDISYLDTAKEQIIIKGYDLIELIQKKHYEDVAYLLIYGNLPTSKEAISFNEKLVSHYNLPQEMYQIFKKLPKSMSVMDSLRTGISILSGYENVNELADTSRSANIKKTISLIAKAPVIAVNSYRALKGLDFVMPDTDISYAENFLYMLKGQKPDKIQVDILDKILTSYIEHEMPNSTFATRVIASTLSDMYGSITGAVASLKGPLHGGANEAAIKMFLHVLKNGGYEKAEEYILEKLKNKEKIMGFGHRVYMKKYDPRAYLLKDHISALVDRRPDGKELYLIYQKIESVMAREKSIYPNLDYPVALLYYLIDIPIDLYTPIFLCSRAAGLAAHHTEQHEHNRLFRPRVHYTGKRNLKVL